MAAQRAIILSVHSFLDRGVKVGTQYIAEGLAANGWEVDYVSIPSSPLDIFLKGRQRRLIRTWIGRQDVRGITVSPHLTEYTFRTLYPAHKLFLRGKVFLDGFSKLAPMWLRNRHYEICIHDITANMLFLPYISTNLLVLRLNDVPEGFAFHIHEKLISCFKEKISSLAYDEIWAVSGPLSKYALQLNQANNVAVLPNGIEDRFFSVPYNEQRSAKKIVYLGSMSPWVNLNLIEKTSTLLPDWHFHIYGPDGVKSKFHSANLQRFSSVSRDSVPTLLAEYQVGMIPFRDICNRMNYVERPLKFYEYVGAGLGVASTDIGALRNGMKNLAAYGNTPVDFAHAITKAAKDRKKRNDSFRRAFIKKHLWQNIVQKMCARISNLNQKR